MLFKSQLLGPLDRSLCVRKHPRGASRLQTTTPPQCGHEHVLTTPGRQPGTRHSLAKQAVTPLHHRRRARSWAWQSGGDMRDTCPPASVPGHQCEESAVSHRSRRVKGALTQPRIKCGCVSGSVRTDFLFFYSRILQLINKEFNDKVPKSTSRSGNLSAFCCMPLL